MLKQRYPGSWSLVYDEYETKRGDDRKIVRLRKRRWVTYHGDREGAQRRLDELVAAAIAAPAPKPPRATTRMHTYCIVDGIGHAKIGQSNNIPERLEDLQCANPFTLRLHGTIENARAESFLHRKYRHLRVRGEWYRAEPELLAEFQSNGE